MQLAALTLVFGLAAAPASEAPVLCLGRVDVKGGREGLTALLVERTRALVVELGARVGEPSGSCAATLELSAVRVGPIIQVRLSAAAAGSVLLERAFAEPYERFPQSPELAQSLATTLSLLRARRGPETIVATPAGQEPAPVPPGAPAPVSGPSDPAAGAASAPRPETVAAAPPSKAPAGAPAERFLGIGVPASAAFGVSLVATTVGVLFGVSARRAYEAQKDEDAPGRQLYVAETRSHQRWANVGFGVALTSLVTGAVFAWVTGPEAGR